MTNHDAKSFLHNIDDSGLGFIPSRSSPSLTNMGLHLHQGLQHRNCFACLLVTNDYTGVPWIKFSHLPFAWSRLLQHERTKGCDTFIQVARLQNNPCYKCCCEGNFETKKPGNTRRSQTWHLSVQAQAPPD